MADKRTMQSPAGTNAPEADLAEVEMHKATIDAANNASDPRAAQLSMEAKTIQGQLYKLKPWTYAQLALLVLILFLFLTWHWQLVLVVLALLIPTLGKLLMWWQKNPERCPLDHVLSSYCLGLFVLAVPAMATALIAFVLAFWILVIIFFSLPLPDALSLLLVFLGCWGVFCLIEDLWHVSALRRQNRRRAHHHRGPTAQRKAGAAYAAATAVGYATAQCVALTCIVTAFMDGHSAFELHDERRHSKYGTITPNEGFFLFVLALIFTWYWLPLRLLCSHLLALEVARNDAAAQQAGNAQPPACCSCDDACPATASGQMCGHRCSGFWNVIGWPLTLRTLHMTSFLYITIFLLGNFFLWLAVVFVSGALLMYGAWRRVLYVEDTIDPNAREAAGLRELYGFSLLAGDAEEAAVAPPATTLAPPVVAAEPYIAAESTVAVV